MRRSKRRLLTATVIAIPFLALGAVMGLPPASDDGSAAASSGPRLPYRYSVPVSGNPATVIGKYETWKLARQDSDVKLRVGVQWSKGLSTERSTANGWVTLDLESGMVQADIAGLAPGGQVDLWLLENDPESNRGVRADPGDRTWRVGRLTGDAHGTAELTTTLDPGAHADFRLDYVVITAPGKHPTQSGLAFGTPGLFERLYQAESSPSRVLRVAEPRSDLGGGSATAALVDLVALGEDIFFNFTFRGNGRTCGTCHPSANNFTIDPDFVAQLPPNDPLFVAIGNDDLPDVPNPDGIKLFEVTSLMLSDALILENVDGFPELDPTEPERYVLRSVPHLFGLQVSTSPISGPLPHEERLGWSGDGSPLGGAAPGSLRDFAIGAVKQHFTKTMNRSGVADCLVAGPADFCFPNATQLDALEAFQLSLGRQEDFDTDAMAVNDVFAEAGRVDAFTGGKFCNRCHLDAGAQSFEFGNPNLNIATGAEALLQIHDPNPDRLPDGGEGTNPQGHVDTLVPQNPPDDCAQVITTNACTIPELNGSFGSHRFNTPSLVEAADTTPLFHNNLLAALVNPALPDLEASIEFYFTDEAEDFLPNFPPSSNLTGGLNNVARFLRVLNSVDNIDHQAVPPLERGYCILDDPLQTNDPVVAMLDLAETHLADIVEVVDAVRDLPEGPMTPDPVPQVTAALAELAQARTELEAPENPTRAKLRIVRALIRLCFAREDLLDETCPIATTPSC